MKKTNSLLEKAKTQIPGKRKPTFWDRLALSEPALMGNVNELIDHFNAGLLPGIPSVTNLFKYLLENETSIAIGECQFRKYVNERLNNAKKQVTGKSSKSLSLRQEADCRVGTAARKAGRAVR